ncbi:MAG: beta-galactosidase [Defluviitaleaceae bacterium]|nr:beta-galactosidase [Defluviitaleaceae bacterium]MCL2275818.1 beta-galactosidase [Defluviitaleaceae bacterium]
MQKRLHHGGDYNPDQWLKHPEILADDIKFMQQVKANTFSVGIFAWAALEPQEGEFTFEWLDSVMDNIASFGGQVILATPTAARPAWLSQKYPEVTRTSPRREKMLHGARHNHCFTSPVYREKTSIINRKLAERYKNHPALFMWHISNEYNGECHCDLCRAAFSAWLEQKYGTIDTLNDAYWSAFWSHTYNDFSQVEPPSDIGEIFVHGLTLDWRRFVTHQTIDFYKHEIVPLREITPNIPITTNFMGDFPQPMPFAGLNYAPFAQVVDVISWDAYPPWHNDYECTEETAARLAFLNDYFRSLKNAPFFILESTPSMVNWHSVNRPKRPEMHLLSSVACLAHGADAIMYFQWRKSRGSSEKFHGAVIDHDNSAQNRVFKDVAQVGEMLERVSEIKGSHNPAEIAIIYDTETMWALGETQGFIRADKKYPQTVFAHYKIFRDGNAPVDVISPDKCCAEGLSRYKAVIAPMLYMMPDKLANALALYVENGGTLVTTYISGMVNESDLVHHSGFHPKLREILGIQVTETDSLYPTQRNGILYGNASYKALDNCAVLEIADAEILGTYEQDFYAGSAAVTHNAYGKGAAYFIAARTEEDFLAAFYEKEILNHLNIALPQIKSPRGVSIQTRTGNGVTYYFVMNFTDEAQTIQLPTDMCDLISGRTLAKGQQSLLPKYGAMILK